MLHLPQEFSFHLALNFYSQLSLHSRLGKWFLPKVWNALCLKGNSYFEVIPREIRESNYQSPGFKYQMHVFIGTCVEPAANHNFNLPSQGGCRAKRKPQHSTNPFKISIYLFISNLHGEILPHVLGVMDVEVKGQLKILNSVLLPCEP